MTEKSFFIISGGVFMVLLLLFGSALLDDFKNAQRAKNIGDPFHIFNEHLKDICSERSVRDECPRDESELSSYNPQLYALLNKKTKTFYSFDNATQKHVFSIRYEGNNVYVSHDDFYPGVGYMSLEEARERYGVSFK